MDNKDKTLKYEEDIRILRDYIKNSIGDPVPHCKECGGVVKPDVSFTKNHWMKKLLQEP